jgi:hypothetical protein
MTGKKKGGNKEDILKGLIIFWDNFTNTPQTLPTFADTPLIFKNSHLPPLNFQKLSLTPTPYKLGHKILKKYRNTPVFYF